MNSDRPPLWRKSTASAESNCVEVAANGDSIMVRSTRNRQGATLTFTTDEWKAFLVGARAGEFEVRTLQGD